VQREIAHGGRFVRIVPGACEPVEEAAHGSRKEWRLAVTGDRGHGPGQVRDGVVCQWNRRMTGAAARGYPHNVLYLLGGLDGCIGELAIDHPKPASLVKRTGRV